MRINTQYHASNMLPDRIEVTFDDGTVLEVPWTGDWDYDLRRARSMKKTHDDARKAAQ